MDQIIFDSVADHSQLPGAPVVSVAMASYNHEAWIDAAIAGVLAQITDFSVELVISEDYSTDATRLHVRDWQRRHPDRIRLLLPRRNVGAKVNVRHLLDACRGEFIAICEGDDCWTDPRKLQQQIDLMRKQPGTTLCCHRVIAGRQLDAPDNQFHPHDKRPAIVGIGDLLDDNWIATCSVVTRREIAQSYPAWQQDLPISDWPIQIVAAQHGDIAFIDSTMGFYRVHPEGAWQGTAAKRKLEIKLAFYLRVLDQIPRAHKAKVHRNMTDLRLRLIAETVDCGDWHRAKRELWAVLGDQPIRTITQPVRVARLLLGAYQFRAAKHFLGSIRRVFRPN